jgi:hypothetical protein
VSKRAIGAGLLAVLVFSLSACFPSDANLTQGGKGLPELTAELPPSIETSAMESLTLTISNPGPGDMTSLIVSFSRVGAGGQEELPEPLIDVGVQRKSESIVSIEPEPDSISLDATIYRFDPLAEGESITIVFEIRAPAARGEYANAVVVYDGQDVERARGVRIDTTVTD